MAKYSSVEWLAQSFYAAQTASEDVDACGPRCQIPSESSRSPCVVTEAILRVEIGELAKESREEFTLLSPNNSCGYVSGSDSEAESLSRRMRTRFTSDQIRKLEKTFNKNRYLGAKQRRKVSEKLRLSETQVKIWFQNRRMKLKREAQNMLADFLAPTSMLPPPVYAHAPPRFQHRALAGQLQQQSARAPYLHHAQTLSMHKIVHQPSFHPMTLAARYY